MNNSHGKTGGQNVRLQTNVESEHMVLILQKTPSCYTDVVYLNHLIDRCRQQIAVYLIDIIDFGQPRT